MAFLLCSALSFVSPNAASYGAAASPRGRVCQVMDPDLRFARASDLLSMEELVTAKDVVNVLGRWETYQQWERVGELPKMDKMFDVAGQPVFKMQAQQTSSLLGAKKGNGDWVKKTPQRRGFCLRQGLCQR